MKEYVKLVEAEQFNGDMASMTEFIGPENTFVLEGEEYILTTPKDKWRVALTDYVAKDYYGLLVFKEARFLDEFTEVTVEDEPEIKEVPAPEFSIESPGAPAISETKEETSVSKKRTKKEE